MTDPDPVGPSDPRPLDRAADAARRHLADRVAAEPPPFADLLARRNHRRRRQAVAGIAAVVAVATVAGGAALLDDRREGRHPVVADAGPEIDGTTGPSNANADLLAPGTSEVMPPAPIDGRTGAASAWTGTEVLVWGGIGPGGFNGTDRADGAAYDPRHRTWRVLAPSPLAARHDPAFAWTGTELLVWAGGAAGDPLDDGAAYDPSTDTWRLLAPAPIDGGVRPATVWTGRELVVIGGLNEQGQAAAYDPASDTWRELDRAPGDNSAPWPRATWTGTEVVLSLVNGTPNFNRLVALNPDEGTWRPLPPLAAGYPTLFSVDGAVVAVDDAGGVSAVLDSGADEWRPLSSTPSTGGLGMSVVRAGDLAVGFQSPAFGELELRAIDLRTGAWSSAPVHAEIGQAIDSAVVWADGVVVAWGGFGNGPDGSATGIASGLVARPAIPVSGPADRPPPLPTPGTVPPDVVPVADDDGERVGYVDLNGEYATWNGRLLVVRPVHGEDGQLVGYLGCTFLEREEVERDDFERDPSCNQDGSP